MIDDLEVLAVNTVESFGSLSEAQVESLLEDHHRSFRWADGGRRGGIRVRTGREALRFRRREL